MKDLKDIEHVYFVGIGGIGMSALARYFVALDKKVAGYDKTPSAITKSLEDLGITICFEEEVTAIPKAFLDKEKTLVVYTPAIPKGHKQLGYFENQGFDIIKRAAVLGAITKDTFTLAVAGTHGKTTTTAILAYLLKECGVGVTAFLGGISENYQSNLVLEGTDVIVVEADEFDRSFLQLYPDIAAITSMDADHLDIYDKPEALHHSFMEFVGKVDKTTIHKNGLPLSGLTFGIEDDSEYCAFGVRIVNGTYIFNLKTPTEVIYDLELTLPGRHNLLNAITAFAMAQLYGTPTNVLAKALSGFKGVQRRFSYQIKEDDLVYIDDYAHHPTELDALHQAVREMHPDKKILAVFQPHLYSRTRDFAADFATSLSRFDELLLLDIYPARELPIAGITSGWLLDMVQSNHKSMVSKDAMISRILDSTATVVLTIGAGDIGVEVGGIKSALLDKIAL